jgi:nucleoside-diphosphate-sugar epimerase
MNVIVTGATGHLGSAVVPLLRARGHVVVGLSSKDALPALGGDVALVHLAAWHPPATAATTAEDRRKLLDVNVFGTMRLLDAARERRATCVIYASTFEVYGAPQSSLIDEDHPTRPLSDYGATKLSGEDHLLAFAYEEKTRVVALRMPAIYGPGEKTRRLLPSCLNKVARGERPVIEGDGGDLRDQLYIDDAALAIALALEKEAASGIYNVADGGEHSVAEIARLAMKVAAMSGEPDVTDRKKPRLDYHMSIAKAVRELGFAPQIALEEGMRRQLGSLR